jgi:cytoskeleton protein RodZ
MTLGAYLKSEREARAISLETVARETKLGIRMLQAIEADRFDKLPEGMFRNAFIKTYAKQIGLDGDQVLRDFHLLPSNTALLQQIAKQAESQERLNRWKSGVKIALGALVILALIGYLIHKINTGKSSPAGTPAVVSSHPAGNPPAGTALPPATPPKPDTQTGAAPASVPPENAAAAQNTGGGDSGSNPQLKVLGELAKKPEPAPAPASNPAGEATVSSSGPSLNIIITEKAWISVVSGDRTLFSGLLHQNDTKSFPLDQPLKLTVGNAGGIQLSVGGQVFRPLGASGEVRVILVSLDNYQQYLSGPPPAKE